MTPRMRDWEVRASELLAVLASGRGETGPSDPTHADRVREWWSVVGSPTPPPLPLRRPHRLTRTEWLLLRTVMEHPGSTSHGAATRIRRLGKHVASIRERAAVLLAAGYLEDAAAVSGDAFGGPRWRITDQGRAAFVRASHRFARAGPKLTRSYVRAFRCPACGSAPGERCRRAGGQERISNHIERAVEAKQRSALE